MQTLHYYHRQEGDNPSQSLAYRIGLRPAVCVVILSLVTIAFAVLSVTFASYSSGWLISVVFIAGEIPTLLFGWGWAFEACRRVRGLWFGILALLLMLIVTVVGALCFLGFILTELS